jgi:hypothetical protein
MNSGNLASTCATELPEFNASQMAAKKTRALK